jgi:hypothetical protein
VKRTYEANAIKTGSDRQKALEGAHVAAYREGFRRTEALIASIVKG